jgi:hypothetical protein
MHWSIGFFEKVPLKKELERLPTPEEAKAMPAPDSKNHLVGVFHEFLDGDLYTSDQVAGKQRKFQH